MKFTELLRQKGVVLWGAGSNGKWCYDYLVKNNFEVLYFIDSKLAGKQILGKEVISFDKYKEMKLDLPILITAKHAGKKILESLKCTNYKYDLFDKWFFEENKSIYKSLYCLLDDKKSKIVLKSVIKTMKTGNENFIANVAEGNQYFSIGRFFNVGAETYVDLGAYVGDTIEKFIFSQNGGFNKIYAFEPGSEQLKALNFRIERLKKEWALRDDQFEIIEGVVSNFNGITHISNPKSLLEMSIVNDGDTQTSNVRVIKLDDYFSDTKISFIKCDIEGAEMEMLEGSASIIVRDKPKMALSVYHRPDDLINMVAFIKTLVPEYKFALRQHSSLFMDLTLYCYI